MRRKMGRGSSRRRSGVARWAQRGLTAIVLVVLPACDQEPPATPPSNTPATPTAEANAVPAPAPAPTAPPAPAPADEGTRRMAARLARLEREIDPRFNPFANARRAEMLHRALAQARTPKDRVALQSNYATELLLAGRFEDSVRSFEAAQRLVATQKLNVPEREVDRFGSHIRDWLAVAHLRLGEYENCLQAHSADSCIMPFRGSGIHVAPRGSRRAIELLTESLNEAPDNLTNVWLLNLAYMTLGEHPDKVPAQWLVPPAAFESDYDIKRFHDIAPGLGLNTLGRSGGAVVEDFDRDGDLDIMASAGDLTHQLRYFRNNGDGTFSDRTREANLTGITGGLSLYHTDYNNDGFPDVLMMRGAWLNERGRYPNSLLRNNGDGTFSDVTEEAGLLSFHPTQTAAWGDYNNDGWIDLFIGNETSRSDARTDEMYPNRGASGVHPCELYHNNGDGTFTERAAELGLANVGFVKAVIWGDYNNDGRLDLYLSRLGEDNVLYRNDGPVEDAGDEPTTSRPGFPERPRPQRRPWRFTDVTQAAGVAEPKYSFPTWFWDYDNDGWLDLFVSGYGISTVGEHVSDYLGQPHTGDLPRLYHNNGDGTFTDVTVATKLNKLLLSMAANFGDLDNDGYPDFYVGTGMPDFRAQIPNRMFRNDAGRAFQDVTTSGGFGNVQKGHAIVFADLDNDGDQDVFEVMGGAYEGDLYYDLLLENPGHGNHWIKLLLEGRRSNRLGVGARIRVRVVTPDGERDIHKLVTTGATFGSTTLRQEIGLGNASAIRFVEVNWPASGRTQVFENPAMDQAYRVTEGNPRLTTVRLTPIDFSAARQHAAHKHNGQGG